MLPIYETWHNDRMLDMGLMKPFYQYNKISFFSSAYQNTVYRIKTDSLISAYKWDFNKDNIKIECYNNSSESNKLGFYTNVAGWTGENSSLTEGGSSINKLYNVSVYIWKDKTDGMTIKADKTLDIADDYFTKVDSVKEG